MIGAWIAGLGSKAWGYVVAAGAAIALVAGIFWVGRRSGQDNATARQHEADEKTRGQFDAIDRQPVDFGAAVDRLRRRTKR